VEDAGIRVGVSTGLKAVSTTGLWVWTAQLCLNTSSPPIRTHLALDLHSQHCKQQDLDGGTSSVPEGTRHTVLVGHIGRLLVLGVGCCVSRRVSRSQDPKHSRLQAVKALLCTYTR